MTRRSRSSFDLSDALGTAESLSPRAPVVAEPVIELANAPVVSFQSDRSSQAPRAPSTPAPPAAIPPSPAPPLSGALGPSPELGAVAGLAARLGVASGWLRSDPQVERVLVVDGDGLRVAGDDPRGDELAAATGALHLAVGRLARGGQGGAPPPFEACIGERPVLQLLGVVSEGRPFVVGITRSEPYSEAEVRRIRAVFRAALGQP